MAQERIDYLTSVELNQIEQILVRLYPEGVSEGALNAFFWLEEDTIAKWLGYETFDEIMVRVRDKWASYPIA